MKTKPIFFSLLFAATVFTFMANCSGNKKEDTSTESPDDHAAGNSESDENAATEASAPQFEVDKNFQRQLGNAFTAYVSLKDAFVSSDAEKVKSEATATSQAVSHVDMKLLSGAAHSDWMTYLAPIENSLKEIAGSADLEIQRKAFSILSGNLYKSIKAFGLGGKEAFYEYCPMAFNNEGAYWLSDEDKIRNPYFGDEMLTCGEVKEKLQ